jgi:AraC family transcriptional regulator
MDPREVSRQEYVARINRVLAYIRGHLDGDLSLRTLARVANFSPYHFHRVFRVMVGEPVGTFVRRLRVLTAAQKLAGDPARPITIIARECGFSSSSSFAREFRHHVGMSASAYRRTDFRLESKDWQLERKIGEDGFPELPYTAGMTNKTKGRAVQMTVEVKTLPELHVAYIRHVGPYNKIGSAFEKLMGWAGPRGLLRFPETKAIAVYHDCPDVVEESKLTSSACITVPKGTPVDGPVKTMTIPGGLFAVGHTEIFADQFGEAWDKLMQWLPTSGYQPDDRMCYEVYLNDHTTHPERKFVLDICEPIRPL